MAETNERPIEEIDLTVDRRNLYREETYTDLKVASIRCLSPVKDDGSADKTRKMVFVGQTQLMTPGGPLPVQAIIPAKHLQQAIKKFPEAMMDAVAKLTEEVKKYQQQERGSIVTPAGGKESDSRIIIPGR